MGVRAAAVADDDHRDRLAPGRCRRHHAAAAEALVVGMGCHDDEAGTARQGVEVSHRQTFGGGKEGVGVHGAGSGDGADDARDPIYPGLPDRRLNGRGS